MKLKQLNSRNKLTFKMDMRLNRNFKKKTYKCIASTRNMFDMNSPLRHVNQKHKAISPHSSKNGYCQKDKRYALAALYTVGGNVNQQSHYGKQNEECQS